MVVAPPIQESLESMCKRTEVHPMHVVSTAISPDPVETRPENSTLPPVFRRGPLNLNEDGTKINYKNSRRWTSVAPFPI